MAGAARRLCLPIYLSLNRSPRSPARSDPIHRPARHISPTAICLSRRRLDRIVLHARCVSACIFLLFHFGSLAGRPRRSSRSNDRPLHGRPAGRDGTRRDAGYCLQDNENILTICGGRRGRRTDRPTENTTAAVRRLMLFLSSSSSSSSS